MQINITDDAKLQLRETLTQAKFEEPALRVVIAGMG